MREIGAASAELQRHLVFLLPAAQAEDSRAKSVFTVEAGDSAGEEIDGRGSLATSARRRCFWWKDGRINHRQELLRTRCGHGSRRLIELQLPGNCRVSHCCFSCFQSTRGKHLRPERFTHRFASGIFVLLCMLCTYSSLDEIFSFHKLIRQSTPRNFVL